MSMIAREDLVEFSPPFQGRLAANWSGWFVYRFQRTSNTSGITSSAVSEKK